WINVLNSRRASVMTRFRDPSSRRGLMSGVTAECDVANPKMRLAPGAVAPGKLGLVVGMSAAKPPVHKRDDKGHEKHDPCDRRRVAEWPAEKAFAVDVVG